MPRPSIDFLNARRAAMPAGSGGKIRSDRLRNMPAEYVAQGEPYDCTGLIGEFGSDSQWPMFSYSRPGSILWNAIAGALNEKGWTDEEIETWLASKNTRWALDGKLGGWLQTLGREFAKSIDKSQIQDCD